MTDTPSLVQQFSRPFISGVLGFLPLALTLAVLAYVVVFLHDLIGPASAFGRILSTAGMSLVACEVIAYSFGLIATLAIIYVFGLLVESGIAHRYQGTFESALHRVPLVSTIFDASKQLTSMFDRKEENIKTMTPVLCSFGGPGGTATLALMPNSEIIHIAGHDYHVVIVPTAPVPFGGALLCVPVNCVQPAGCTLDGLVNVYMSMGVSAPDHLGTRPDAEKPPIGD